MNMENVSPTRNTRGRASSKAYRVRRSQRKLFAVPALFWLAQACLQPSDYSEQLPGQQLNDEDAVPELSLKQQAQQAFDRGCASCHPSFEGYVEDEGLSQASLCYILNLKMPVTSFVPDDQGRYQGIPEFITLPSTQALISYLLQGKEEVDCSEYTGGFKVVLSDGQEQEQPPSEAEDSED